MLDEPSRAAGKRRVVICYKNALLDGQRKARGESIILRSILALGTNEAGTECTKAHSATFDREGRLTFREFAIEVLVARIAHSVICAALPVVSAQGGQRFETGGARCFHGDEI